MTLLENASNSKNDTMPEVNEHTNNNVLDEDCNDDDMNGLNVPPNVTTEINVGESGSEILRFNSNSSHGNKTSNATPSIMSNDSTSDEICVTHENIMLFSGPETTASSVTKSDIKNDK